MSKMNSKKTSKRSQRRNHGLALRLSKLERAKEIKHLQRQVSQVVNVDTDGHISSNVLNIAQGTTDTTRIGDKVALTKMEFRVQFDFGFDTVDANPDGTAVVNTYLQGAIFRYILIIDHTNSIDAVDKVLGTATADERWIVSNSYNVDYRRNYTILCDNTVACNPTGSGINCEQFKYFKFNRRFKSPLIVQYNAGTTTVNSNAIKMLYVSNIATSESNNVKPDVLPNFRFYYTD